MSYEPDDDRVTRGVGAIAAADKVSPGRYRRRIETGIATRKRDRAMAAVANGALSGTSIARPVLKQSADPRDHRTTVKAPVNPNAPPPAAPPPPPTPKSVASAEASAQAWARAALHRPTIVQPTVKPTPTTPVATTTTPVGVPLIATVPTPTGPAGPATSATTATITGTGPSTQGTALRGVVSAIFDPVPIQSTTTAPIVETDNTTRNLAIAGGAILAAYLLFFRGSAT